MSLFLISCSTRTFNYQYNTPIQTTAYLQEAALFDPLAPLYPDTEIHSGYESFTTDVALGSSASIAILVSLNDIYECFTIETSTSKQNVEFYEMKAIPISDNTGFFGMTEKRLGFDNPYVVRHAPFSIYEVLMPSHRSTYSGKQKYAFYLKVPIPQNHPPGIRTIWVKLQTVEGDLIGKLEWKINIHPIHMPSGEGAELLYTNWFRGPQTGFKEPFDENWWALMETHIKFMGEGGQNVAKIPNEVIFDEMNDGKWLLNAERLERFMSICEQYGFLRFEGPPPGKRKSGYRKPGILILPGEEATETRNASERLQRPYSQLNDFLSDRGSTDVWLQHVIDEPLRKHADAYRWIATELMKAMPNIHTIDAVKTRRPLVGYIDTWVPLISEYQRQKDFFTERQQKGEDVWIYSCMVPGGPWLNRTMDQERLRSVYIGWGCSLFDISGYLRWDLDAWRDSQDIWNGELSGSPKSLIRRPFGDGFVTFPDGHGGLLSTTRWEAGRIGMEDYRLLNLLNQRNPDEHKSIIDICFTDFKTYKTDPAIYRKAKRQLLVALSETQ